MVHTHYSVSITRYSPNQTGSKAKHGAKCPATAKAKAAIAKAKVGGLAKAKSIAKEASSSMRTAGAASNRANLWAKLVLRLSRAT